MFERLNEITNKIHDVNILNMLKNEISKRGANIEEIIEKFINDYETLHTEKTIALVNFGCDRTIDDYRKIITKMNPCSAPQNYSNHVANAKGKWKTIYEIAFGSVDSEIQTTNDSITKEKQRIIKEAA